MTDVIAPTIKTREQIEKDLRRGVPMHNAPGVDAGRPERKPEWLKVRVRQGENFTELREHHARARPRHRLRAGRVPEHLRVLGSARGDVPRLRRSMHPQVRVL